MIISEPLKLPTHCEKAAINGGTTAPPDIPIIISPKAHLRCRDTIAMPLRK